ncbi:NHLP leader peptide family natural product precursor [Pannonibacter tanglangensis]|uniref:NHLP leader peptide family natural product n=1 Tax=Pannonibacter tanglangensis TaxID=2750084 RepID=A0ABW9ZLB5_9HYPH|nr:NHLP leader peptide family natural product precursor [Pannonibacter sp. XCT-34]NBN65086.1 NHLP leader peptide family natural product precursor [Pannonibacter sp. XCT-34]
MTDFLQTLATARAHIEATLLERAGTDAGFRALLQANPHAALRDLFGSDPIPSVKISVVEEAAGEVILVLPRPITGEELPDDLLDYAAGGAFKGCKGDGWTVQKVDLPGVS